MNTPDDVILPLIVKEIGIKGRIEFGKYIYSPQDVLDDRIVFRLNASEAKAWFDKELINLNSNQEIALQSICQTDRGELLHIPMIDFADKLEKSDYDLVCENLYKKFGIEDFYFFNSGRSLHLYGFPFIPFTELSNYLGLLLLLNDRHKKPLIDTRWVGHRLLAGYTALRWTKNTNHYVQLPKLVTNFK